MQNHLAIGLYVGAGMALAFIALALVVLVRPAPLGLDLAVTRTLQQMVPEDGVVTELVLPGHSALTIPLLLAFVVTVLASRQWMALVLLPLGLLPYLVAGVVKDATERPRPSADFVRVFSDPGGWSFPSHTATGNTILLGLTVFFLWNALGSASALPRNWGRGLLVAGAAAVFTWQNASILYSGRHWFTDVVGAWLLGGASIAVLLVVWHWWRSRRRRKSREAEFVAGTSP